MNLSSIDPRRLLQIDAVGALVSAVMLGGVLPIFSESLGLPVPVLYFLAAFPVAFLLYNAQTLLRPSASLRVGLRVIAVANASYVVVSIGALLMHLDQLRLLGWAYFPGEIAIVATLAVVEWRVAEGMPQSG